ncbi:MAG: glutamate-5-semialdehyde dehydrogenase [Oscillospiraceae bacterium]|nr:glutamate-5-semialdehyde dehydrogenase [Oscillospiraceae bacterium]
MTYIQQLGINAKSAEKQTASLKAADKNAVLELIAKRLLEERELIKAENAKDIQNAHTNGMTAALIDRLTLTDARIDGMAEGVRQVRALADPVGEVIGGGEIQNGLKLVKRRVPLGVIGIIFESRPNVTVDAASLCLKSGNVCILRGGSDAINSNKALVTLMRSALRDCGVDENAIQLVEDTSREVASEMMRLRQYIDVLIPRGGGGLISAVVNNSTIPVIETGEGNCHVFVDESADLGMALDIVDNAKTQRPSVCNAIETVIVHAKIADEFYTALEKRWEVGQPGQKARIIPDGVATDEDYATEFLDYVIAAKTVNNLDEAIAHINRFGTKHSEAIVTRDYANAVKFQDEVDAAAVYVNASTRFTDGFVFGLGAEIGITTQKLHARGPMGLQELTTYKYLINGDGQVRG